MRDTAAIRKTWLGGLTLGVAAGAFVYAAGGTGLATAVTAIGVLAGVIGWFRDSGADPAAASRPSNAARSATHRLAELGQTDLQALLEGLHDAALILNHDATVIAANLQALSLLPVVIGRHISQTSRSPELLALVDATISHRTQQKGEARILAPVEHHLNIIVSPIPRVGASASPALLVVLRDLSDQEQLSRMRADFVANASHELRTPLASLKGFLETLRGPARDDPAAREKFIAIMQDQADRMSRLIDDLLCLSHIEMREHVRPMSRVNLGEIVQYVVRTVEPLASKAGVGVFAENAGEPLVVRGEREDLIQLTQNLTQNAIKYGRRGGTVRLELGRQARHAILSVTDDGIGIAPEHLPRLTERFYRVSAKDSRERGGTGLGLAIAKHIVNRHQGELRIESVLGKGSTFTVLLPLESGPPAQRSSLLSKNI